MQLLISQFFGNITEEFNRYDCIYEFVDFAK